jgi:hypothetical protein
MRQPHATQLQRIPLAAPSAAPIRPRRAVAENARARCAGWRARGEVGWDGARPPRLAAARPSAAEDETDAGSAGPVHAEVPLLPFAALIPRRPAHVLHGETPGTCDGANYFRAPGEAAARHRQPCDLGRPFTVGSPALRAPGFGGSRGRYDEIVRPSASVRTAADDVPSEASWISAASNASFFGPDGRCSHLVPCRSGCLAIHPTRREPGL